MPESITALAWPRKESGFIFGAMNDNAKPGKQLKWLLINHQSELDTTKTILQRGERRGWNQGRRKQTGTRKQLMWQLIDNVYSSFVEGEQPPPTLCLVIEYLLDDDFINYLSIIASTTAKGGQWN